MIIDRIEWDEHNLDHATRRMTMHLAYEGVTTPFVAGREAVNYPE